MKNFIQKSYSIDIIAPINLTSGVPFLCGKFVAIPVCDAAEGELVTIYTEGIFELNVTSQVNLGDPVYLQKDGTIITTPQNATPCGFAVEASSGGVTKIMLSKSIPAVPQT